MPIFEYSCDDCGSKFEKLVRRSADADAVRCPSCGQAHLTTQYSTFAARSGAAKSASSAMDDCGAGLCGDGSCGEDMCGGGMCQGGMCGMNMN
jgi:putative FmdB family regulatory protein